MSQKDCKTYNGRCCKFCKPGTYKQKDCNQTEETQCAQCEPGSFTATENYMEKCLACKKCNNSHLRVEQECTAQKNTVCVCVAGFYCKDADCEHCRKLSVCPPGQGVKAQGSGKMDTVCSPCKSGTYSNVSDYYSPCKAHTRCEDIRRELLTAGTAEEDASCGDFINECPWMLPAGLWSGLVLTGLLLFVLGVFWWRIKRKLYRTVSSSGPDALVVVPAAVDELPLPSIELNAHFQKETYKPAYSTELPFLKSEDPAISCDTQDDDNDDSNIPITPFKASVSFTESHHINDSSGYSTGNYRRTFSEPQEDEWCGT